LKIQVHINKKTVSINDRAFNYGDGLFETILVKNNKPKLLNQHIKRLFVGCKRLSIKLPGIKLIKDSIQKAIGSTNECIIKIIYTRGISGTWVWL
jgi:branched-subunit amino acid aminotransferase/4-amino-4-deoxychorismate lyase